MEEEIDTTDAQNFTSRDVQEGSGEGKLISNKFFLGVILFGFFLAAISIPLYRLICAKIDPGGSSWQNGEVTAYEGVTVDESRTIKVRFATNVEKQLPWEFYPKVSSVEVHPGEKKLVRFYSRNLDSSGEITGKAVYDINPPQAGAYFKKIECFCFQEQTLEAGEEADMPLYFWFDPDIPENITEITLAYTFFNADTSLQRSIKNRGARVQK